MEDQEERVKSFIAEMSSSESSTVNMMSVTKPISQLKESFEKVYVS